MRRSDGLRCTIIVLALLTLASAAAAPRRAWAADRWDYYADLSVARDVIHDGNALWIATSSGIVRFDKTSINVARRYQFYSPFTGTAANPTIAAALDGRGRKWFAHDEPDAGLSVVDTLGNWSVILPRDGLLLRAGRKANTIFATGDSVWAGTESGLTLFIGDRVALRLDADDGLPSNNVRAIARTGSYVWIGTDAGLGRLLGGVVTIYRTSNGLVSNDIRSLGTRGDELWVGTVNGISVVRAFGDTIRAWTSAGIVPGVDEEPNPNNRIATVFDFAFEDTIPWIATRFGPARFEGALWQRYPTPRGSAAKVFGRETRGIATVGSEVWIGNSDRGAAKFDEVRDGWQEVAIPSVQTNFLGSMDIDASGDIWLTGSIKRDGTPAGEYNESLKFNGTTFTPITTSSQRRFTWPLHDIVRVDSEDRKWVGFWNVFGGLRRLNAAESAVDSFDIDVMCEADANRRQACTELRFAPDGIHLWAGFDLFGLVCLRPDRDSCMSWINVDGISNEPEGASINGLALDQKGRVWMGFFKNAAAMLDPGPLLYSRDDDVIVRINQTTNGLPDQRVHIVEVDSLGRVWFGTEAGLAIYDPGDSSWVVHRLGANILDQSIRSVAFLPEGSALVGDNSGNVYTIRSDRRTFGPTYNATTVGFPKERVSAIKYDALRTTPDAYVIWFATYGGGLVRFALDRIPDENEGPRTAFLVYPNPFIVGGDAEVVTFGELRGGSSVGLYTLAGEMVRMLTSSESATSIEWDTRNTRGQEVASGVYFYVVRQNGGDYGHGKLAIIR